VVSKTVNGEPAAIEDGGAGTRHPGFQIWWCVMSGSAHSAVVVLSAIFWSSFIAPAAVNISWVSSEISSASQLLQGRTMYARHR
jgi:hypothetical protein